MPITTTRQRHQPRFRRLTVLRKDLLTPRMMRVVLGGPDLGGFHSPGFDDHVRLFFPAPGAATLPTPAQGEKGLVWPEPRPQTRDYTPRHHDAARGELAIDFVLHAGGVASDWAEHARVGDELGLGGPRGSFIVEGRGDWQLLMGDATALPAIARRLGELGAADRARVVIEVEDAAEEQPFETAAQVDLTWLHRAEGRTLAEALDGLELPEGEGFAFFAAEASVVEAARARFEALGHPASHLRAANYWRRGEADAHQGARPGL